MAEEEELNVYCCFQGTLPVFLKQILSQTEDTTKMWDWEYKMVTSVALVRNIEHSSTKITYTLEDFSGESLKKSFESALNRLSQCNSF